MQVRRVAGSNRGGYAALGVTGGSAADRFVGDDHAVVERERSGKTGDSAADDDGRRRDEIVDDHDLTASIRVTASRARSAIAGWIFTSCCR